MMHILIADTKRPPKIIFGEWPRYTEAAFCRVYAVAALYEDRVIQRAANSEPPMCCYAVSPLCSEAVMLAGLRMWAAYMPAAYYVLGRLCA